MLSVALSPVAEGHAEIAQIRSTSLSTLNTSQAHFGTLLSPAGRSR